MPALRGRLPLASGGPRSALLLAALLATACDASRPAPTAAPTPPSTAPVAAGGSHPAGRPVPEGEPAAVSQARSFLAEPRLTEACGPYRLMTDARPPQLVVLRTVCAHPVAALDATYTARLGLAPAHRPRGTLVVFGAQRRFRALVAADGRLPQGYAGFSVADAGLVALPVEGCDADEIARTLTHELAHLAHRRTFGAELLPWLAEGLADAVSDTAGAAGFAPLAGFTGVEGQRRRLLDGYASGQAGALARLAGLTRERFDRGTVAYDYEQSALLVRFLLLDGTLAPGFRASLAARAGLGDAARREYPPPAGPGWAEIEARFRAWLARGG